MPDVPVQSGAAGAVEHHQRGGVGGVEGARIGDVEHEIPPAAGAEEAREVGSPLAGVAAAGRPQIEVAGEWRPVDEIGVLVAGMGQRADPVVKAFGQVGDLLLARGCIEAMQEAVIAADIEHRGAPAAGGTKARVVLECMGARRRPRDQPETGIHDVALARPARAQRPGRRRRLLPAAVAPDVVQPLPGPCLGVGRRVDDAVDGHEGLLLGGRQPGPLPGDAGRGAALRPGREHQTGGGPAVVTGVHQGRGGLRSRRHGRPIGAGGPGRDVAPQSGGVEKRCLGPDPIASDRTAPAGPVVGGHEEGGVEPARTRTGHQRSRASGADRRGAQRQGFGERRGGARAGRDKGRQ